jgi:hypothetical protein
MERRQEFLKLRATISQGKYSPLGTYLLESKSDLIELSFAEIEEILGFLLPGTARRHSAWWANEKGVESRHVQAASWISAGFTVKKISLKDRSVLFERDR